MITCPTKIARSHTSQDEQVSRTASSSAASTSQGSPRSSLPAPEHHTYMRFSGRYSTALSEGSTLLRAGYIGCNNVVRAVRIRTDWMLQPAVKHALAKCVWVLYSFKMAQVARAGTDSNDAGPHQAVLKK
eukprot:1159811-Pelagomonas_calceolata.AAC.1